MFLMRQFMLINFNAILQTFIVIFLKGLKFDFSHQQFALK